MDDLTIEAARRELGRAYAEAISALESGATRARDILTSVAAWAASTIVALNAAAIPLILSSVEKTRYPVTSLILASAGLIAAFISAGVLCVHLIQIEEGNRNVVQSIKGNDVQGPLDELKALNLQPVHEALLSGRKVALVMIVAPLLFFASVCVFAARYEFNDSDNEARCRAIQRDMLAAHRRMVDGPDVFQALGCRPHGSGIIRVPPIDRELAAGRPLKDGGYPQR